MAAVAETVRSGRVWIVDPLDGTVNYANGIPFFCVSIALVAEGRPVVGVVYDPTRDETFAGAIDGPSLRNGEPIHVGDKETARGPRRRRSPSAGAARSASGTTAMQGDPGPPVDGLVRADARRTSPAAVSTSTPRAPVSPPGTWPRPGSSRSGPGPRSRPSTGGPWFDLAYPAKKWSCLAASPRTPRRDAGDAR